MAEPRIQYAKTSDGVSIAYWTLGEGLPFVQLPLIPWSHVQVEWQQASTRCWYEGLSKNRKVIRYDARGTGLSDRNVADLSLDALVLDLQAVVDRLQLERFALLGMIGAGRVALAYAARHPERVSHLLLWCSYARGEDWRQSPQAETLVTLTDALMEKDWETYTETRAHVVLGWSEQETAAQLATLMQESVTPAMFLAFSAALDDADVTDLLAQIQAPTLVLHRKQLPHLPIDAARSLVSEIPDAHLILLEGKVVLPWLEDSESVVAAMDQFQGLTRAPSMLPPVPASVVTIFFTDIVGHTEMMQRLGDDKGRDVLREHERITRETLKQHGGAEVKTMGDGFMASFGSVTQATECAIALQRAFEAHTESMPEPLHVRVGLNAGEPIEEDGDLFGSTVILASRIAAKAGPGEILVPDTVRGLLTGKGFLFADRGDTVLKGFEDPVRLYEVRWRDA